MGSFEWADGEQYVASMTTKVINKAYKTIGLHTINIVNKTWHTKHRMV